MMAIAAHAFREQMLCHAPDTLLGLHRPRQTSKLVVVVCVCSRLSGNAQRACRMQSAADTFLFRVSGRCHATRVPGCQDSKQRRPWHLPGARLTFDWRDKARLQASEFTRLQFTSPTTLSSRPLVRANGDDVVKVNETTWSPSVP